MATIHKITAYSISYELENDIRKKAFSEEEIADIYEQLKSEKQKLSQRVKILLITGAVLSLVFGISTYVKSEEILLALVTAVVLMAVVGAAALGAMYANIGKIAKQWNKLIGSYYSQIGDKYIL